MVGSLRFVTPEALVVCAVAVVPILVSLALVRRHRRVARALGLDTASARSAAWQTVAIAGACLAFGIAAAQPVLSTTQSRTARSRSEVVFVVDVSRSMLASASPGSPTRLERARNVVSKLRGDVPDVPSGVSGLTDRVLPYLFPSLDLGVFAETVDRSVQAESPPPQEVATVATSFAPLSAIARDGFYSRASRYRTCVLVTDGETRSAADAQGAVGQDPTPSLGGRPSLGGGEGTSSASTGNGDQTGIAGRLGCRLVVVRVGTGRDRIFGPDGKLEAAYRPESSAGDTVGRLADVAGGVAYDESELGQAAAAVRQAAEVGPTRRVGVRASVHSLAPLLAAVGLALVLVVVASTIRWARLRPRPRQHYDLPT